MKFKNELEIDVGRCLHAIIKKRMFIIFLAVLCFFAGVAITINPGDNMYASKATVYAAANGSYAESSTAVSAMNAYTKVASSYKVCQRAALLLGRSDVDAERVMASVKVSSALDSITSSSVSSLLASSSTIITFEATTNNPELSMAMADAMSDAYVMEMQNIIGMDAIKSLDNAYTYEQTRNASTHAWKIKLLALFAGLFVGVCVVIFFEIFDNKVRTIREGSVRGQLPIIGVIPDYKE